MSDKADDAACLLQVKKDNKVRRKTDRKNVLGLDWFNYKSKNRHVAQKKGVTEPLLVMKIKEAYLDNSATTKVSKKSCEAAVEMMRSNYYNPSSLYEKGFSAETMLTNARKSVAKSLKVTEKEIFFTSGGTESNNLAVLGAAMAKKRLGNKLVTTKIEHHSVLYAFEHLQKLGFEVVFLPVDESGMVAAEDLENAIDENTILVSVMLVNNEVGSVQPVQAIKQAVVKKKSPALIHCDAVQAYGKMEVDARKLGVDLLSVSAHKVHAPKGAGALYIRKGIKINPLTFGGGQEQNIRPGTEPLPAICAFAAAVDEFDIASSQENARELWNYCKDELLKLDGVTINSSDGCLPYIINFAVTGIRSEIMLHHLSSLGVLVSSGSACAKGGPSHVLTAMGLEREIADSSLRASFSKYTVMEEIDLLISGLKDGISSIIRI